MPNEKKVPSSSPSDGSAHGISRQDGPQLIDYQANSHGYLNNTMLRHYGHSITTLATSRYIDMESYFFEILKFWLIH